MRVALVITDEDFYAGTGYADAWEGALRGQGCDVERLARVPDGWGAHQLGGLQGPQGLAARFDLAVAHVLVEEVAAFAPTLQVASLLEAGGVPLVNPVASVLASSDKLVTHAVWAAAGVPQPAVWDLAQRTDWPEPGRPMVLKPSLADGARDIQLVHDLDEARGVEAAWREDEGRGGLRRGVALLQQWVEEPACVRLFATPHEVSLAYEKSREDGELVTHGTVYPRVYEAPPEMAELAQRMVATLGGGLMGVDVLVERTGRLVALEANAPFGFDVTDPGQGEWVARAALSVVGRRTAGSASASASR